MKKYFPKIIIFLSLFILVFGIGAVAHAQTAAETSSIFGFLNPLTWVEKAVGAVAGIVLKLMSLVTGLSGVILNWVIDYTIVNMKDHYDKIKAIDTAWSTIRDVANMGFIFVLLYASIQMILGAGSKTRELIINIVIAALLVNFSLFFTKVVIDASNVLTLTFYNAMVPGGTTGGVTILNAGLSNALMEPLGLTSLFKASSIIGIPNIITIGVMGSAMLLISAFIFFSIAMMFIVRYVVLILVLILSPIAFVSNVIPGLSGVAKQWKDALVSQAVFAPVYMLLTWITISVFQSLFSNNTHDLAAALTGTIVSSGGQDKISYTAGSIETLFNFIVVIVFLVLTLIISKQISSKAGGVVNKFTGALTGFASGVAFGGAGALGRRSFGNIGARVAENPELIKKVEEGTASRKERLQLWAGRKLASSSFDLRNTAVSVPNIIAKSEVGRALDLDTLSPIKVGGFAADISGSGVGKGTTAGGVRERAEAREKRVREDEKVSAENLKKAETKLAMQAGIEAASAAVAGRTPAQQDAIKELVKTIKNMSDKDIEGQKASTLAIQEVAEELSARQLEKIQGSDKFNEDEKKKIIDTHFAPINTAITSVQAGTASEAQKNILKNLSDKEIEMLPEELFDTNRPEARAFIKSLSQGQIDNITKTGNSKFTNTQKQAIKEERARPLKDAFTTNNWAVARTELEKAGATGIAKMPGFDPAHPNIPSMNHDEILEIYTPSLLMKLAGQSDFNSVKSSALRASIIQAAHASPTISQAITALQTPAVPVGAPPNTPPTIPNFTQRQAILNGLASQRERRLAVAAEYLESALGQTF